jgi:hypothetical protein
MATVSIPRSRLLNITTGVLHTRIEDIYTDIEGITGMPGVMTHQLPAAAKALVPYLRRHLGDAPVWEQDLGCVGVDDEPTYTIPVLAGEDLVRFKQDCERIYVETMTRKRPEQS